MCISIRIDDDLYMAAKYVAKGECRSIANQVEFWAKIGKAAILPLIKALKDKDSDVRKNAVISLGKIGDSRAVIPLIKTLTDQDSWVRKEAARALGVSNTTIMFKHLLPNALAPVIVQATLGVAAVILTEAGLSFLGFGDPLAVSWGTAIQWGMTGNTLRFAPWVATIPGIAIFVVVLGFNLMGDALRDALDPRLKS